MTFLRAALAIPAFVTAMFLFNRIGAESRADVVMIPNTTLEAAKPRAATTIKKEAEKHADLAKPVADRSSLDAIIERRLRIDGLLSNLDHVAAVAMQMKPEESDRLEPIIVDLAERTLELVDAEELRDPSADTELDDLESTLKGLMQALTRQVQTETTL